MFGSAKIISTFDPALPYYSNVDLVDREILQLLQEDASMSARELGERVGLTATPCWRRVQNLEKTGIISRRVALLEPSALNLDVTALVQIRTNDHSARWLAGFQAAISDFPEIVEATRTSGETDYMLRVVVPDISAYDNFYKRLIDRVDLYDVRSVFVMEELKRTTALPLDYTIFSPG
ncbi:MAG: Lrp/AsnC family transcriptional regulator [Candidatus Poriferisodalaceae bacterium]